MPWYQSTAADGWWQDCTSTASTTSDLNSAWLQFANSTNDWAETSSPWYPSGSIVRSNRMYSGLGAQQQLAQQLLNQPIGLQQLAQQNFTPQSLDGLRQQQEWMRLQLQQIDMEIANREAQEAQRRVIAAHVATAQSRALDLLIKHLTPEQRETFQKNKWFIVEGGRTGRRYRIRDKGNMVANIDVLEGNSIAHRLCGHCAAHEIPLADNLLAQKLMIEADEEAFLRIANRHAA